MPGTAVYRTRCNSRPLRSGHDTHNSLLTFLLIHETRPIYRLLSVIRRLVRITAPGIGALLIRLFSEFNAFFVDARQAAVSRNRLAEYEERENKHHCDRRKLRNRHRDPKSTNPF